MPKHIDKYIKECPYCGHNEYYQKQRYKGICNFYLRYDGKDGENGEMWESATFENTSNYAWCGNCHKRLFKLV